MTPDDATPCVNALDDLEKRLRAVVDRHMTADPSHDIDHLARVWRSARDIAESLDEPPSPAETRVDRAVLLAACYLHDLVNLPKDHPERHRASRMAADAARPVLGELGFDSQRLEAVCHAIEAHSFSAGLRPRTLEAAILQDADRLEALGAIGLARLFHVAGQMGGRLFDPGDFHGRARPLDDRKFAIDHVRLKLHRLADSMNTARGRELARARLAFVSTFVDRLEAEVVAAE